MSNSIRNIFLALIASVFIAGCSSTPEDTSASEEEVMMAPEESMEDDSMMEDSMVDGGAMGGEYGAEEEMDPELKNLVVYFDFDKATIRPDAIATLQAHANYLSNTPSARVRVEGHADERGTREYNMALGERRAKAVSRFLQVNGVSGTQVESISFGEEKPAVLGHSDSSWSQNRRVELKYVSR